MSIGLLAGILVQLVIIGLIFYLLYWAIGKIGLPEPFNKVAIAVITIFAVFVLIDILLGMSGRALVRW